MIRAFRYFRFITQLTNGSTRTSPENVNQLYGKIMDWNAFRSDRKCSLTYFELKTRQETSWSACGFCPIHLHGFSERSRIPPSDSLEDKATRSFRCKSWRLASALLLKPLSPAGGGGACGAAWCSSGYTVPLNLSITSVVESTWRCSSRANNRKVCFSSPSY